MREAPGSLQAVETEPPAPEFRLLIVPEPWFRAFRQNLVSLFRWHSPGALQLESAPAAFWPDVFVDRGLPWRRFLQSGACHVLALAVIWAGSRFVALQPHPVSRLEFTHSDVVYYTPSEYLLPLDTRRPNSAPTPQADPESSFQPVVSVPREADNRSQTIVTPPNIKLQHDVAMPDVVALLERMPGNPRMPIGPTPAVPASEIPRLAPPMDRSVIAPPPDLQATSQKNLQAPQQAVIAPPPIVDASPTSRLGDLNIARSSVIAPAPQLSLDARRAMLSRSSALTSQANSPQVIAPPPSLSGSGHSRSGAGMIALSLHPAVSAAPDPPAGNRRGIFATTPEGHRGASGAAGSSTGNSSTSGANAGNRKTNASESARKSSGDLPSGLYVGELAPKNSIANSVNPNLISGVRPPRVSSRTMQPEDGSKLSEVERAVFGDRKFYSLSLNMPNLNSAGGSWIIRFAALKPESTPGGPSARAAAGTSPDGPSSDDLSAPAATRKVDPAYPLELMRQNVGGTVILYAIIHSDGTVGSVRVLRSVDERLDGFAREAIAKWQFQPALKNGAPVDVEATFWIPFRPAKVGSNF
jgi:TonB family protein